MTPDEVSDRTVLVVDDEPDNICFIRFILEEAGFKVLAAYDGFECMDVLKTTIPDLILLDIMMPGQDGWETFHKIKTDHPDMPVIIVTSMSQEFDRMFGLQILRADDYIVKPFDEHDLLNSVRALAGI